MRLIRPTIAIVFVALQLLFLRAEAQFSPQTVVKTDQVRAELLAHAPQGVAPGQPVWLGLQLTHKPEWHTYWKNSGDSGQPTQLEWTLPPGVTAGEIDWPVPKKIPIGRLANYGYEGTVLLPVPLTISPGFRPGPLGDALEVRLRASWLVCRRECIPEEGEFALRLPLRGSTAGHAAAFDSAFAARPQPVPTVPGGIVPASTARIDGNALALSVQGLPAAVRGKVLDFFPETPEVIETAATPEQRWNGAEWTARVPLAAQRSNSPTAMPVVLASGGQGWRAELKVLGAWPTVAAPAAVSPALDAALKANAERAVAGGSGASAPSGSLPSLWAALIGALVGGLILNLMPCVFPVLAIKVMGFARHADDLRRHRISGLAYTAGVLVSFIALGALLLALRAAGEAVGWGFQLQAPGFVAALAVLFTLIGLNLAGLFEFGGLLPSSWAAAQARHPVADAFLTGVLAVVVASPCTAPFMGAAIGLAATLPAGQALAVFAMIGVGLALPYLAASWWPALAQRLPRPGAWMVVFRQVMAFPMFATVVWLLWVLGQQSGIDGAAALLALLVALAMLLWAWQLPAGRARTGLGAVAALGLAALLWALGPRVVLERAEPASAGASAEGPWQAWAPGRVEELTAQGRTVFVDFTAAWCVTCQLNKKTTFADRALLADMQSRNIVLMRADWTRRDPAITATLAALGRNGVPVYAFYKAGQPPKVLSELPGVEEVRAAMAGL